MGAGPEITFGEPCGGACTVLRGWLWLPQAAQVKVAATVKIIERTFTARDLSLMDIKHAPVVDGVNARSDVRARVGFHGRVSQSTRDQLGSGLYDVIFPAASPVRGPRFFSNTLPFCPQINDFTPVLPHSTGQATIACPAIMEPLIR